MILRTGRIDDNVLDRSVRKRLGAVLFRNEEDGEWLTYSDSSPWRTGRCGMLAIVSAVNGLAAQGVHPETVRTDIFLPAGCTEETLRYIEDDIAETAKKAQVRISGGHTEVTEAVARPIVVAAASGRRQSSRGKEQEEFWRKAQRLDTLLDQNKGGNPNDADPRNAPGWDILVIGHIGLAGTFLLATERRKELEKRFPVQMIDSACAMENALLLIDTIEQMREADPRESKPGAWIFSLTRVSEGGIYGGLWKLSHRWNCGFEINLLSIPIYQETIEICNYYNVNPYQIASEGCLLALTGAGNGERVEEELESRGIFARKIGQTTCGKDPILINGDERQFLNRPAADSLIPLLG